jgi:hypothetical protein
LDHRAHAGSADRSAQLGLSFCLRAPLHPPCPGAEAPDQGHPGRRLRSPNCEPKRRTRAPAST